MNPAIESRSARDSWVEITPQQGPTSPAALSAALHSADDYADDFALTPAPNAAPTQPAPTPATSPAISQGNPDAPKTSEHEAGIRAANQKGLARSVFARLRSELRALTEPLQAGCAELNKLRRELNERGLAPGSAERLIADLEASVTGESTPDELEAIAERVSSLRGFTSMYVAATSSEGKVVASLTPTHSPIAVAATGIVSRRLEPLRVQASAILDAAESKLAEYLAQAKANEERYFTEQGLPVERTAVSRRVEAAQAKVKAMRSAIEPNDKLHPQNNGQWTLDFESVLGELVR